MKDAMRFIREDASPVLSTPAIGTEAQKGNSSAHSQTVPVAQL